jgi:hypothetical protein
MPQINADTRGAETIPKTSNAVLYLECGNLLPLLEVTTCRDHRLTQLRRRGTAYFRTPSLALPGLSSSFSAALLVIKSAQVWLSEPVSRSCFVPSTFSVAPMTAWLKGDSFRSARKFVRRAPLL